MSGSVGSFSHVGSENSNLGLVRAIVDMVTVEEDIKTDKLTKYYYDRDYIRVRIPSLHGLNKNSSLYPQDPDLQKMLNETASTALPWARISQGVAENSPIKDDKGTPLTGKALREKLGFKNDRQDFVYLMALGGDMTQLVLFGRAPAVGEVDTSVNYGGASGGAGGVGTTNTVYQQEQLSYLGKSTAKGFQLPSVIHTVTETFGEWYQEYADTHSGRGRHIGLDYVTKPYPQLFSITKGEVYRIWTGFGQGWGNFVVMKHSMKVDGKTIYFFSGYAHMADGSVNVREGQKIDDMTSTHLGIMAGTPSYGVHLHFCIFSTGSGSADMPQGYVDSKDEGERGFIIAATGYRYYSPLEVITGGEEKLLELMKAAGDKQVT